MYAAAGRTEGKEGRKESTKLTFFLSLPFPCHFSLVAVQIVRRHAHTFAGAIGDYHHEITNTLLQPLPSEESSFLPPLELIHSSFPPSLLRPLPLPLLPRHSSFDYGSPLLSHLPRLPPPKIEPFPPLLFSFTRASVRPAYTRASSLVLPPPLSLHYLSLTTLPSSDFLLVLRFFFLPVQTFSFPFPCLSN